MSQDKTLTQQGILLRIAGALGLIILAALLGGLLGRLTAPQYLPRPTASLPTDPIESEEAPSAEEPEPVIPAREPPVYLHLGIHDESVWKAIEQEVAYGAASGLHRYIVPVPLGWSEEADLTVAVSRLERILTVDPEATFILDLDCNPPATWFEANPDARMEGVAGESALPTPASEAWRDAARKAIDGLHGRLQQANLTESLAGYLLGGLEGGQWQLANALDLSASNVAGYRAWLTRHYEDDVALQKAWRDDAVKIESVAPTLPATPERPSAFLDVRDDAAAIDYRRYRAESVADAIAALASHLRTTAGGDVSLWARYGYTFEMGDTATGHLALLALLDSDLDGFVAPVSLANRGIGGTGGYMGPIHSAVAHEKQWIIIDDTRTGFAWSDETGQIDQIRGLRPEDVYNVQRRNFALAAVNGLGIAWSDPNGRGALCNEPQWELFDGLMNIYRENVAYPGSRLEIARQTYPEDAPRAADPTLLVVIDEESQFLTRDEAGLAALLTHNRDEILRAGVTTEFCLLQDFLDNRSSQARVYLFLNIYNLPAVQREVLHARFAEEEATAIWVYAPGYRDVTLTTQNIADTVGMTVKAFEDASPTGSVYTLGGGQWLDENQSIGTARPMNPLFYIEDSETDVLAQFKQTEKPSVAMRTMEAGWTSIYLADPELSAPLLREILRILEQPIYFRPGKQRFFDVTVARGNLLGIHAGQVGDRMVNLSNFHDIQDLFDQSIGWPQKESFVLNLEQGETRLLQLSPL